MRATAYRRVVRIAAGAAGLGVAVLAALPAAAGTGQSTSAPGAGHRPDRYNTGATHSPQVLRQLAGGVAGRPAAPLNPLPGALQGVDVASFQHPNGAAIDWTKVAAAGIQFAAVKVTEGAYYQNPYALTDLQNARAAGLSVMAYAFAIPNGNGSSANPVTQADYLLSYLGSAGGTPPTIMLDMEYNPYGSQCYGLSKPAMASWIASFDAEIVAKTGQDPVLYIPPPWWQTCTGGVATFHRLPLWVPDFSSATSPILPAGWTTWAFWQYSSTGQVNGISAAVDLDQLNPARIPLLYPGPQHTTVGGAVSLQIRPADPVTGRTLSFTATGLPPGTSISTGGLITGQPSSAGTYTVTVKVTDGTRHTSIVFTWSVAA